MKTYEFEYIQIKLIGLKKKKGKENLLSRKHSTNSQILKQINHDSPTCAGSVYLCL